MPTDEIQLAPTGAATLAQALLRERA